MAVLDTVQLKPVEYVFVPGGKT